MKPDKQKLLDTADGFQRECHKTVERIMEKSDKATYQDAANTWLYIKLAELQLRIEQLEFGEI